MAGCDLLGHASNQNEAIRAEMATTLVALAAREGEGCVLWSLVRAIEMTFAARRSSRSLPETASGWTGPH